MLMSNKERRFMWNLAFFFTMKHARASVKALTKRCSSLHHFWRSHGLGAFENDED